MPATGQRLLLVEDDLDMAESIGDFLGRRGWRVEHARNGALALHLAAAERFAVIVLDRAMPVLDGLGVCRVLRAGTSASVPVLMLTAADSLPERLEGFEAGVDDYLVKPFAPAELHARLTALVRRSETGAARGEPILRCADLELDPSTREVRRGGRPVTLTNMGFAILEILLRRAPALFGCTVEPGVGRVSPVVPSAIIGRGAGDVPDDTGILRKPGSVQVTGVLTRIHQVAAPVVRLARCGLANAERSFAPANRHSLGQLACSGTGSRIVKKLGDLAATVHQLDRVWTLL
jgi:two-component system response regulator MprA